MSERPTRIPNAGRGRTIDGADGADGSDGAGKRPGTGRTVRGRRTRQLLVEAARTVFERDGFLHARIADICDEALISHGSFYTYFLSKEQIFKEVVDSVELDLLRVEPNPALEPIERIRSANRHYFEHYLANAGIMRVIQQVATFDAEVRATRVQRQDEFAHAVERRTREYQNQGLADPDVDPWFAANALGGMAAFLAEKIAQDNAFELDSAVDQLTLMWANSIGMATDRARR